MHGQIALLTAALRVPMTQRGSLVANLSAFGMEYPVTGVIFQEYLLVSTSRQSQILQMLLPSKKVFN